MKKIVIFINSLSIGGAERQACILAGGLADKNYDVTITTFGEVSEFYSYNNKIHRKQLASGKGRITKMLAIWKYFLTLKTDWVIAFGQRECSFCLRPLMLRSRKKIRVIAGDRNTTIGNPSRRELELFRYLYGRVDYIVPNSYTQRRHILEANPCLESKTITITNYTEKQKFLPTPLPCGNLLHICVFSRYSESKNCIRFVEAIMGLKKRTNRQFLIEWYGDRYIKDTQINPMYARMANKVEEYGLKDCLILKDMTNNVIEELAKFDVCCLPSLHEGFSNSISEAICCGKPCLVSDVSDNSVMVKDGINGFLFDPNNEEDIINAFIKLFKLSSKELMQWGNASRQRAEELFNYDTFIQQYINLIES